MQETKKIKHIRHRGHFTQIPIYLGKFFRMFVYQDDWKVIPMAAVIAGLVAFVIGKNMFVTMEGTIMGALGLTCICIWNGFFNSIQVVCRERDVVKREHRSGMHITSYIAAHMIYQAFICLLQTIVTVGVGVLFKVPMPFEGFITAYFYLDIAITIFMITYAADMMSLAVSCLARTTTAAMTIMPFMLIFELLFSGKFFQLEGFASKLTSLSIAKWGLNCIGAQASYNKLPMVTVWNQIFKFRDVEIMGLKPLQMFVDEVSSQGKVNDLNLIIGSHSTMPELELTTQNIYNSWINLGIFALVFAALAWIFLKRIDKDKR